MIFKKTLPSSKFLFLAAILKLFFVQFHCPSWTRHKTKKTQRGIFHTKFRKNSALSVSRSLSLSLSLFIFEVFLFISCHVNLFAPLHLYLKLHLKLIHIILFYESALSNAVQAENKTIFSFINDLAYRSACLKYVQRAVMQYESLCSDLDAVWPNLEKIHHFGKNW